MIMTMIPGPGPLAHSGKTWPGRQSPILNTNGDPSGRARADSDKQPSLAIIEHAGSVETPETVMRGQADGPDLTAVPR